MPHAIVIHEVGGPEQMCWESVAVGEPGPGQARVRHTHVGLNFLDVYFRTGLYPAPQMPFTPGTEGAGVVEAVGEGVDFLKAGDRVAYGTGPMGSYAEQRLMPADVLLKIPDGISNETAAAMMLKGLTSWYLLRRVRALQAGDTILFHAAAGGVGLIACQWAKSLGATVIGTVGSDEKAEIARAHGCDHPINYNTEDFTARVKELTDGKGLPVVYDSVGQATFLKSLDCLHPMGMMVSFGQSSGAVEPLNIGLLAAKGALFLTRPSLNWYGAKREDIETGASELFDQVLAGKVRIEINNRFPLSRVADAHRALEGRKTTGSTVLTVEN
ncbi:MAG: quinone oxidoreductase [Aquisalimonadaceae bacterium]